MASADKRVDKMGWTHYIITTVTVKTKCRLAYQVASILTSILLCISVCIWNNECNEDMCVFITHRLKEKTDHSKISFHMYFSLIDDS